MSDLQIVLIIFGGLIIVAVLIFNWWQERRFHQQVENTFSSIKSDALLEEPTLDTTRLYDNDHLDSEDFSINHELIQVAPDAMPETETDDLPAQPEPEQTFSEHQASVLPATIEMQEADVMLPAKTAASVDHTENKVVNHDGIKAIFEDAFNKSQSSDHLHNQNGENDNNATPPSLPEKLHAQVDLIAVVHLPEAMAANAISNALKEDFGSYEKPVFIFLQTPDAGWLLSSEIAAKPELAQQKILKLACGLQLADRAGPASRSTLNRFQLAIESLGMEIGAHVEWQGTTDPVADAIALDSFCIDVDKTMGFHLVHGENGAFTGTKLRGLAEAQGLQLAADGSFKYYDEASKRPAASELPSPSFVMFNRDHYPFSPDMLRQSVVKGITFQLDIPHVSNCTEAFNHMVLVARQMETGLHAQLVDDNNKPLGDAQIEKIRHQLRIIQAAMLARNIAPGSDVALRLFS